MKNLTIFSFFYWVVIFIFIFYLSTGKNGKIKYSSGENYNTQVELYSDFFNQLQKGECFEWCCNFTQFYADLLGFTYEEINVIVFVIIQPAMMFFFVITTLYLLKLKFSTR